MLADERKGGDQQVVGDTVERRNEEPTVRRAELPERDGERQLFDCERLAVGVSRYEHGAPLLHRHLAGLVITQAEKNLGGLVVEEQRSLDLNQEDRHGKVARHLQHRLVARHAIFDFGRTGVFPPVTIMSSTLSTRYT